MSAVDEGWIKAKLKAHKSMFLWSFMLSSQAGSSSFGHSGADTLFLMS